MRSRTLREYNMKVLSSIMVLNYIEYVCIKSVININDRQTGRQTDRQTDTHTHTVRHLNKQI